MKNIMKIIYSSIIYFLACSPILWASTKIFFFNVNLNDFHFWYWTLPFLWLLFVSLIYFSVLNHLSPFLKNLIPTYVLILALGIVDGTISKYCTPKYNPTISIQLLLGLGSIALVSLFLFFLIKHSSKLKWKSIILATLIGFLSSSIFYLYSILYLYDKIWYELIKAHNTV